MKNSCKGNLMQPGGLHWLGRIYGQLAASQHKDQGTVWTNLKIFYVRVLTVECCDKFWDRYA